jgi:hypothetical protein
VGLARRIRNHPGVDPKQFARVYEALLADPKYVQAVSRSTADEAFVSQRLDKATEYFAKL